MSGLTRRRLLSTATLLTALPLSLTLRPAQAKNVAPDTRAMTQQLARLESTHNGRLGVALMNVATGAIASHRGDERFLFNSTIKFVIAAALLARIDQGHDTLDTRLVVSASDLVGWTPVTEQQLGAPGMTLAALCQAAVAWSDNAAANVLIRHLGGPGEITRYLKGIGDDVTRLDRTEPALNEHDHAGDERDTTTPLAMMQTLRTLLLGDALSPASRHQLSAWMIEGKTGGARLRAGMPAHWLVGEKTGTNSVGNASDIGVAWPGERGAVIAVAYTFLPEADSDTHDGVIAEIGRLAATL